MATKIEWARNADGSNGETWNPVRGCSRVSAGCDRCFAMRMARRMDHPGGAYEGLTRCPPPTRDTGLGWPRQGIDWSGLVRFIPDKLGEPLKWRKPRRVFVCSTGDLFHERVTDEQIAAVFGVMAVAAKRFYGAKVGGTQNGPHEFQVLTKRARRMASLVGSRAFQFKVGRAANAWAHDRTDAGWLYQCITGDRDPGNRCTLDKMWPLPNVWLGVTAENQAMADERVPLLLRAPAAARFVSCEPLLEQIGVYNFLIEWPCCETDRLASGCDGLDWVIAGCESGPGARPADVSWFRSLRDQCVEAGVPYFLKQMVVDGKLAKMPELDGRVWDEVPR